MARGADGDTAAKPDRRRVPVLLTAFTTVAVTCAIVYADHSGASGRGLVSDAAEPFASALALGELLHEDWATRLAWLRWPALAAAIALMAAGRRQTGGRGAAAGISAAIILGWLGQSLLLEGRWVAASALYAAAVAVYLGRRPADDAPTPAPTPRQEMALAASLLTLFLAFGIYRLAVYPELYVDEVAYLISGRMQLGELPPGPIVGGPGAEAFSLERFRAQPPPLLLTTLAVWLLAPGVLPVRLVSLAVCAVALLATGLALRRRLGSLTTLWMLMFASFSPLLLAYGRMGHWASISILHGALCFAALLRLQDRWDLGSATLLGLLLGSSLYFYQLSWFVPILAGLCLLLSPSVWRLAVARRAVSLTGIVAVVCLLPGALFLRSGLGEMRQQSYDQALFRHWTESPGDASPGKNVRLTQVLVPEELTPAQAQQVADRFTSKTAGVQISSSRGGRSVAMFGGPASEVERAVATAFGGRAPVLLDTGTPVRPWTDLGDTLARLFAAPGWQQRGAFYRGGRLVDAPLLSPVLAPLLVLGLAEALRRRREPVIRALAVWALLGTLLPPVLSGVLPRRMLLGLPFLQALMALPLAALAASLWHTTGARRALWLGSLGLALVSACIGAHLYFRHWNGVTDPLLLPGHKLELSQIIKSLPAREPVLLPPLFQGFEAFLKRVYEMPAPGEDRRVFSVGSQDERQMRRAWCHHPPPFHWITFDTSEGRQRIEALAPDFTMQGESRGGFRVYRISGRRPGACTDEPPERGQAG
jgi:hypothetical protein